jgi:predicted PurR-regulated permease PerM
MNISKIAFGLIILITSITILVVGKSFIIPLILALLIWFLIKEIRDIAQKTPFIGSRTPKWLLSIISTTILFILLGFLANILTENVNHLADKIENYQNNLMVINNNILTNYHIDLLPIIQDYIGEIDFTIILKDLVTSLSDIIGSAFMISLYVLFLFFEESAFQPKLKAIYNTKSKYSETMEVIEKVNESIGKYITLKTLVSVITGVASYIGLVIIGVDTPIFWAFLIFVLNYIPTIGSLIATIFPATIALLQFGEFTPFFLTLGIIGFIQLIVGNIIEPKIMGNSLNVSSLVVILSLSFWGMIWGITGMVLSVPITVIMVILFSQFQTTKPIAILLSEKGKV